MITLILLSFLSFGSVAQDYVPTGDGMTVTSRLRSIEQKKVYELRDSDGNINAVITVETDGTHSVDFKKNPVKSFNALWVWASKYADGCPTTPTFIPYGGSVNTGGATLVPQKNPEK